jgi:signal transduction histidine kinase
MERQIEPMQLAGDREQAIQSKILAYSLRALFILFGFVAIASLAYVSYASLTTDREFYHFNAIVAAAIPFILGWLINRKHPGHGVAFLFLIMAYASALMIILQGIRLLAEAQPWLLSPAAESILLVLGHTLWLPGIIIPTLLIPLYFPNGKLLSPRWRLVAGLIVFHMVWIAITTALRPWPWPANDIPETRAFNGIAGSEPFFDTSLKLVTMLMIPVNVLAILSFVLRYTRADDRVREQMKWPILALICLAGLTIIRLLIPELGKAEAAIGYPLTWTMAMLFPIAIGIAILRQGLWDINIVISRTLIYGGLSALIIGLYIAIVGLLGLLFESQTNIYSGLIAAAIIAILFQPLRDRLQRQVNRLLYGERDDPAVVLALLAQHMQTAESPDAILPDLAQTIAQTLKIPYVAIWLPADREQMEPVAVWGKAADDTQTVPLIYHQENIGHLVVAPRSPKESFTRHEHELLATIAGLTATTVHAVQLSDELRRSRRRIVTAREDERRRLRRDLHDGLGPQLASQTLGLEAVSQLMPNDSMRAQELLSSLMVQAEEATRDVRRLVYDLRPPALDDLGLVGALRQRADRYELGGLQFTFDVPGSLPELPAAVETAVYRIAQEAMTNVVRHAQATACTVRITCRASWVTLEIRDNGQGVPRDYRPGVGLQAMEERAAELNGQITLQSLPGGGTLVQVRLPLGLNGV